MHHQVEQHAQEHAAALTVQVQLGRLRAATRRDVTKRVCASMLKINMGLFLFLVVAVVVARACGTCINKIANKTEMQIYVP